METKRNEKLLKLRNSENYGIHHVHDSGSKKVNSNKSLKVIPFECLGQCLHALLKPIPEHFNIKLPLSLIFSTKKIHFHST